MGEMGGEVTLTNNVHFLQQAEAVANVRYECWSVGWRQAKQLHQGTPMSLYFSGCIPCVTVTGTCCLLSP